MLYSVLVGYIIQYLEAPEQWSIEHTEEAETCVGNIGGSSMQPCLHSVLLLLLLC